MNEQIRNKTFTNVAKIFLMTELSLIRQAEILAKLNSTTLEEELERNKIFLDDKLKSIREEMEKEFGDILKD